MKNASVFRKSKACSSWKSPSL